MNPIPVKVESDTLLFFKMSPITKIILLFLLGFFGIILLIALIHS
jgi:hypothetical protein